MRFSIVVSFLLVLFITSIQATAKKYFVAVGDSNGAHEKGWVYQLQQFCPDDSLLNFCIGGNTIGFNNNGRDTLNTLSNINECLFLAENKLPQIDRILVLLGTNDCKAVYDSLQSQVAENLDTLIHRIVTYPFKGNVPEVVLITPPPASPDSMLLQKYYGISRRLEQLVHFYPIVAQKYNIRFVDIYHPLLPTYDNLTADGIHLNETGYKKMAGIIYQDLLKK